MFKNYLKIAFRSISKNKTFSFIKIFSLAIGLSASFVIGLIIYYDYSFDKFHDDNDRIYRITSEFKSPQATFFNRGVAQPLGAYLQEHSTEFESISAFSTLSFSKVEVEGKNHSFRNRQKTVLASSSFFEVFTYQWLFGNSSVLEEPNTVVLSESAAKTYFPNTSLESIVGKELIYDDMPAKVMGIVSDIQERTDLYFQEFISKETARNSHLKDRVFSENWNGTNSSSQVFVKVLPNFSLSKVKSQLEAIATEFRSPDAIQREEIRVFELEPLSEIHFNNRKGIFNHSNYVADKDVLLGLALTALFLLLLACVNFVNLNTAQAIQRSKEIGVRKTLGGSKRQLIFQFLTETFLLTIAAAIVSLLFSFWLLRIFSDYIQQGITFDLFKNPIVIIGMVLLLIVISLLSGLYPSFVLSRFKPAKVLKSQFALQKDKPRLRQYLTVFQFVIAQVFIVATLIVGKQLNYMMSEDMGFKTNANVYIRAWHDDDLSKREALAAELAKIPEIEEISLGGNPPASSNYNTITGTYIKEGNKTTTVLQQLYGDSNYLNLYDIDLIAGRDRLNDTIHEFVINEAYLKSLGFEKPEEVLGTSIDNGEEKIPIVGVMKDFHQRSLKSTIDPMVLVGDGYRSFYAQFNTLHLSINAEIDDLTNTLNKIEALWASVYPEEPLEVNFMDDTIKQFYNKERKTSTLLAWATGLSIAISCLGLLGLVVYTTERRTREIGIRKVLGASIAQLNFLLCKDFLKLVGIAFLITVPIAWYTLQSWLQGFAYQTELSWWLFVVSGAGMMVISFFVMSFKTTIKANANPTKSLRTE